MTYSSELAKLDCAVALERLGGDEELLREVALLFLDEYPVLLREICSAADAGDADALERAAHTMKGSVSNFGADAVCDAAFTLEKMGRTRNLNGLAPNILRLSEALESIHPALESMASA